MTTSGTPADWAASFRPASRAAPRCSRVRRAPGSLRISSVANPALMARGFPVRVPAW